MKPIIVELDQITLLGFNFFGDPFQFSGDWSEENEIGRLWVRLVGYLAGYRAQIRHVVDDRVMYEVHIHHADTNRTGEFEVFAGLEVERLEDVPVVLSAKVLPAATYALFTLQGEEITSDWPWLVGTEWLPDAGYEMTGDYSFQRYDERFKGMDRIAESVLDVYIPVKALETA
ncbi:MAG: GyrI-like domain-containing protein [Anaerolineae bacterium]|jgi:predicted transcriptional regulator YdeE